MRAAAIVMPLPAPRQRRVAVRQDARDRARRAALPRDHRVRAGAAERDARGAGTGGGGVMVRTLLLPILMVLIGIALIVRTLVEGVDGVAFGLILGRPVHRGRRGAAVAEKPAVIAQAPARQPGAVRDRPGLHRRLDLLLDRAGRRARAGADLGRLPGRRGAVRGDRAVLRRGRLAAPGARRRDRDRPLRLQRAGELHRRLGDLPRLPDPGRALRVRVHGLPRAVLGRLQRGRQRVPDRAARSCSTSPSRRSAAAGRGATSAPRCSCSATSSLQLLLLALGLALLFQPEVLTDPASIAGSPSLEDIVFAFPLVLVAFSGIDASSGLAGQVAIGRAGLRRLIGVRLVAAVVPYVGIALVASSRAAADRRPLDRGAAAGRRRRVRAGWLREPLQYLVAISALSSSSPPRRRRCSGSRGSATRSSVNRQIPSRFGSLHPTRATPVGIIVFGAVMAIGLLIPADLEFLAAIARSARRSRSRSSGSSVVPPALQGARPRPAVPDAAQRAVPRRLAADPGACCA